MSKVNRFMIFFSGNRRRRKEKKNESKTMSIRRGHA
jgi:hypothetical protein